MKLMQRCLCCTDAKIALLYLAAKPWGAHAEVDHRTPLALGGKHCAKNLVVLPTVAHRKKTKDDMRDIAAARRRPQLLRRWLVDIARS
jgi:5-methylcytosine-specific restriction endonuclease McrA